MDIKVVCALCPRLIMKCTPLHKPIKIINQVGFSPCTIFALESMLQSWFASIKSAAVTNGWDVVTRLKASI